MGGILPPTSPGSNEGAWTRIKDYVYHGRVPAVRVEPGGSARHYITLETDHLGSTRSEIFDASSEGTWHQSIDLWPYGELVSHPGATLEKHLFTAHEREFVGEVSAVSTLEGFNYMHARYYNFSIGRFHVVDRANGTVGDSQSWNSYNYVENNPPVFIDPFGELKFASDEAKQQYEIARRYLIQSEDAAELIRDLEALEGDQEPTLALVEKNSEFYPWSNIIEWNPTGGYEIEGTLDFVPDSEGGTVQTPALSLIHEFDHAYRWNTDPEGALRDSVTRANDYPRYFTREEERVTTGIERMVAKQLDEPILYQYGAELVTVRGPTSKVKVD